MWPLKTCSKQLNSLQGVLSLLMSVMPPSLPLKCFSSGKPSSSWSSFTTLGAGSCGIMSFITPKSFSSSSPSVNPIVHQPLRTASEKVHRASPSDQELCHLHLYLHLLHSPLVCLPAMLHLDTWYCCIIPPHFSGTTTEAYSEQCLFCLYLWLRTIRSFRAV